LRRSRGHELLFFPGGINSIGLRHDPPARPEIISSGARPCLKSLQLFEVVPTESGA
jgi:hypothetical protein